MVAGTIWTRDDTAVDPNTLFVDQPEWPHATMPHWPPDRGEMLFYSGAGKDGTQWLCYSRAGWIGITADGEQITLPEPLKG